MARRFTITDRNGRPTQFNLTESFTVIAGDVLQAGQGALIEVGEEMVGLAKEYTPVDDGTLRASADEVGINEESGTDWAGVSFGFGGAAASYAVAIHEYPDAAFSAVTQARRAQMGTGWKFLQRAMEELSDQVEQRLAEGISARLESDGNAS